MRRRDFIRLTTSGALLATLGGPPAHARASTQANQLTLRAAPALHKFEAEQERAADVLAFNDSIPGPVLRLRQGEVTEIRFINALEEPSAVHWHGLRIANAMDGVPGMTQDVVRPGKEFVYRFTPPDAGTYWYHSHFRSWEQLALGLAGVLIVEEQTAPDFDQDLVFALDDWRVDDGLAIDTGSFGSMHDWSHAGRLGNIATVNGESETPFSVTSGERIRMRFLNIANARVMTIRLPEIPAWVIALDGQPVAPFEPEKRSLTLAPGQRADVSLDMTGLPGSRAPIELLVRDQVLTIARFEYTAKQSQTRRNHAPSPLPPNPLQSIRIEDEMAFNEVPLHLEGGAMGRMSSAIHKGKELGIRELVKQQQVWAINGIAGMADEPLFRVPRGTAISLNVHSDNAWPHGIHVHGHHFIDSREPGIWRDTALFTRGERGKLRFVADNPGKWLIHCHMLEHQAAGMKTWFEVT